MKFSKDQIVNLVLFIIIILLLFYILDKESFQKISNHKIFMTIKKTLQNVYKNLKIKYETFKSNLNNDNFDDSDLILHVDSISICDDNKNNSHDSTEQDKIKINKKTSENKKKLNDISESSEGGDVKANNSASQYYSENLDDKYSEQIYDFLQTLIEQNDIQSNISISESKKYKSTENNNKQILSFLMKKLNCKKYKFNDLKLLNNVFFKKDLNVIEILPIQINCSCQIIKNKKEFLKKLLKLQLEIIFEYDDPDSIFINQNKFLGNHGNFKISRITILNSKYNESKDTKKEIIKQEPTKESFSEIVISTPDISSDSTKKNNLDKKTNSLRLSESELDNKILSESKILQSNFFEGTHVSDTINSIIPDRIEITDNSPVLNQLS